MKLFLSLLLLSAVHAHAASAWIAADYAVPPGAGFLRITATVGTNSRSSTFPLVVGQTSFTNLFTNFISGAVNRLTGSTIVNDVESDQCPPLIVTIPEPPNGLNTQPVNLSALLFPEEGGSAQVSRDLAEWRERLSVVNTGNGILVAFSELPTDGARFIRAMPPYTDPPIPRSNQGPTSGTNSPSK